MENITSVSINKEEGYICLYFGDGTAQILNNVGVKFTGNPLNNNGETEKVNRYEKALKEISQSPKIRGIGNFESKYNHLIDTATMAIKNK